MNVDIYGNELYVADGTETITQYYFETYLSFWTYQLSTDGGIFPMAGTTTGITVLLAGQNDQVVVCVPQNFNYQNWSALTGELLYVYNNCYFVSTYPNPAYVPGNNNGNPDNLYIGANCFGGGSPISLVPWLTNNSVENTAPTVKLVQGQIDDYSTDFSTTIPNFNVVTINVDNP